MLTKVGRFLFRWRGVIFPAAILSMALAFPPRLASSRLDRLILELGLLIVMAGQALRILTIGWDYIERGGDHGRVSASRLVTAGMYALCRNPMYVGNILLVSGFLLVFGRIPAAVLGIAFCVFCYRAIVASEEAFLRQKFGEEFEAYCARVPRWHIRPLALIKAMRLRSTDMKSILLREYSTLSVTAFGAATLTIWRLHGKDWQPAEFALGSALFGLILGFYLTMRFLKTRRIVYAPR